MAKRIKFHASFPEPERFGLMKVTPVVFELGLGPCGRHVESLGHRVTDHLLIITQTSYANALPALFHEHMAHAQFLERESTPGIFSTIAERDYHMRHKRALMDFKQTLRSYNDSCEIKEFIYKLSDVHGRIEVLT